MKYAKLRKSMSCAGLVVISTVGNLTDTLKHYVPKSEAAAAIQKPLLQTNSLSQQCINCHDGTRGQAIKLKSADTPLQYTGHVNSDHPVGMSYSEHAQREPRSYVSPARLDNRLQLENGEVTCVTCHETNVSKITSAVQQILEEDCLATGVLTVTTKQTGLCMSCHVL